MSGWQPIATAPRDGTQILVLVASEYEDGQSTVHLVTWGEGWPSRFPGHPDQPACWWANENGANYHEPYVQKWTLVPEKVDLDPVPLFKRPELGPNVGTFTIADQAFIA